MNKTGSPLRDDALYQALETPVPYSIWRLGGAGIAVRTMEALLYIDPFLAPDAGPSWIRQEPQVIDRLPPADLMLATHEHEDHTDPIALKPQIAGKALFAGSEPCVEIALSAGFPAERVRVLKAGQVLEQGTLTITALEARDDDAKGPLAYLINDSASGIRLYHGGDSMMSPQFTRAGEAYDIDVCCLSVGGVSEGVQYYLSVEDTIRAALMLRADVLIPVHWDLWTKNGVGAEVWEPLLNSTQSPQVVLVPPGGSWTPSTQRG